MIKRGTKEPGPIYLPILVAIPMSLDTWSEVLRDDDDDDLYEYVYVLFKWAKLFGMNQRSDMFTSEYIKTNWALSAKINARNQLKIYAFFLHKLATKICQKNPKYRNLSCLLSMRFIRLQLAL